MKRCGKCKKLKSSDRFHKNPSKIDGLQSMCKDCRKKYHRKHYLNNSNIYKEKAKIRRDSIKAFVSRYKQFKGCENCNERRWWVLEFHHRDKNQKEDNINGLVAFGNLRLIKIEMRKCKILCSNCHKDLHYMER